MACIAFDDSAFKPEVIIPRTMVDTDLVLTGLVSEKITLRSQPHGFMETRLFHSWFETTLLPELDRRHAKYPYQGPALLFFDNYSAHINDYFHELCPANRVTPCYFLPHSSDQLQPINLSLFDLIKPFIAREQI
jgi:hypothetical protein